MTLASGARLGIYDIISPLGAGGMGEVYRARDTRLDRDVAIKVLPESLAGDPERIARFQREARTLASLNHPNIAAIYGLEEADGVKALVMELIEGPTLADRIAQGPIPVDEALPIARQIAEALEAAHEQGIIHRDLKPANIKLKVRGAPPPRTEDVFTSRGDPTPARAAGARLERRLSAADVADCTVKVLDFGLAKLQAGGAGEAGRAGGPGPDFTQSPTITSPVMMTGVGVILGTAAYMSPEQARGKAVDKRADLWAFGCVLYEMLTGQRAFGGDDVTVTLARVVERDPDFDALPTSVPARVRQALRVCLRKDPKQRVGDIRDVRLALEGAFETAVPQAAAPTVVSHRRRRAVVGASAFIMGVLLAGGAVWFLMRPPAPRVVRTTISSTAAALSRTGTGRDLAITPDGSRIVYVGANGTEGFFVRALDALEPVSIFKGVPRAPFVSPDGLWVGFFDGNQTLKKVAMSGGPAVTLAFVDGGNNGATWAPDGMMIFATNNRTTGLQRISADGGTPEVLTKPDPGQGETDHQWPEMLPGGRAVLFTTSVSTGGLAAAQVTVLDLQTRTHRVLVRGGSHAQYVQSGHLVYGAAGTLRAVAFDLTRLETRGTPVPIIGQVVTTGGGGVSAVVAGDGTLAYVSGPGAGENTLMLVSRQGQETSIATGLQSHSFPRIAPDGASVAFNSAGDIWRWDFERATLNRLTFDGANFPVWTRDGRRLVFSSQRGDSVVANIYWQAADGTGAVERLTESPNPQNPVAVSPDGTRLIFTETAPTTNADVMQIELEGTHRITPLVQTPFVERNGIISPDGPWLAYEANDTGQFEIHVRPFPDVNGGHWVVSRGGGTRPLWARNGQESFYLSPAGALMRVGVERGPSWAATTPAVLIKAGYVQALVQAQIGSASRPYDISPDGQQFLLTKAGGGPEQAAAPTSLIVVQHFDEELKRVVPIGN